MIECYYCKDEIEGVYVRYLKRDVNHSNIWNGSFCDDDCLHDWLENEEVS